MKPQPIICARCGQSVMRSGRARYCEGCSVIVNRQVGKERERRRRHGDNIPDYRCRTCGAALSDGRKKQCPACIAAHKTYPGKDQRVDKRRIYRSAVERREYQRRYYQAHKEQMKDYQRDYNLAHRRSSSMRGRKRRHTFVCPREVVKNIFTASDIMRSPVEKTARMIEQIVRGERGLTV